MDLAFAPRRRHSQRAYAPNFPRAISHRKIRALAESDPEKYAYLYHFNRDIPSLDLGDPVELTPRCGDVLFFQHLFGHNGTANVGVRPRWMMRYFCGCTVCCKRWKKTDQWGLWTP